MDLQSQAPPSRGILQARILEWVATSSSRGSPRPRDWTMSPAEPPGTPVKMGLGLRAESPALTVVPDTEQLFSVCLLPG